MTHALEVYSEDQLIFFDDEKWLHPLFKLEQFLTEKRVNPAALTVKDKIIGKAAALMIVRLKIGTVNAGLISVPAIDAFKRFGVTFEFQTCVDRIDCATEALLIDEWDVEKAYLLLRRRAGFE
ncbi:DUF1893 domain-containing protein [candidate division KSB1 bacterium]|nr:DUF1893 domain-containing protein [candidate division KSB1 bacterium]